MPSHQAPALILKRWRPRWFSGLGLVLGTLAPDLEFIVPVRKDMVFGHTLLGQLVFTMPVVLLLYILTVEIVVPWLVPFLPRLWWDLAALKRPRGVAWLSVALSGYLGGLTHIGLDGFTHPEAGGGWAVAYLPWLGSPIATPFGRAPVCDILQIVLTIVLGAMALQAWRRISESGLVWSWRGAPPETVIPASEGARWRLFLWLSAAAGAGVIIALALKHPVSIFAAVEFAAYGFLDGIAAGLILGGVFHRGAKRGRRLVLGGALPASS